MTIHSVKMGVMIRWEEAPYKGRSLTRVWTAVGRSGVEETSRSGDEPMGRDAEVAALLADNGRHGYDWVVVQPEA